MQPLNILAGMQIAMQSHRQMKINSTAKDFSGIDLPVPPCFSLIILSFLFLSLNMV